MTLLGTRPHSIVIVRHGETDWNAARRIQGRTEVPLNETGRAQAAEAAGLLRENGPWERVVASPLGRAAETARIIADELGLEQPSIDPSIIERNFGSAEGVFVPEAHERWPGLEVPDAETLDELAARGAEAFARIVREQPGTIVVAHGALIRASLTRLGGSEMPRVLNGEAWEVELTEAEPASSDAGFRPLVRRLGAPLLAAPK